jgi:hypothetical protein
MAENTKITVTDILKSLALQTGSLPPLTIDGQKVESGTIASALRHAADQHEQPASSVSLASIVRWLLYSVGVTLFLTVVFKVLGMVLASHWSRQDLLHELLLRGDLLLISAGFAAEAIGDLFATTAKSSTPKWTVGFACVIGLMSSMLLITCCAFLPNDLSAVSTVGQLASQATVAQLGTISLLEDIIRWGSPPVFAVTMLAVLVSKFVVGEA